MSNHNCERAKKLTSQMTLDEKVHLCTGGSYWSTYPIERLGISACILSDGPHGIRKVKGKDHLGQSISEKASGFPTSSAMGSTWNRSLLYEIGQALGTECQSIGVDILLGPAINMKRSVLGGRNFEYFSEDPVLCGKLAAEMVKGIQDQGVGACVKHFACNNSEHMRMTIDSIVDQRTLHEIYLKAFEIIVKEAKPLSIMGSYNKVNGSYACENKELLTKILRKNWGFEGIVLSDWLAVDDITKSIDAGLNLEMPINEEIYETLKSAVQSGELPEETLNERVSELVTVILKLQESRKRETVIPWESHDALAIRAAVESAVLLKNRNNRLPIEISHAKKVAVIGDFAKHPRSQGGGSSKVEASQGSCVYDELIKLMGDQIEFVYAQGYDSLGETSEEWIEEAVERMADCDRVLLFAGLPESYESEGYDRSNIKMPEGHTRLIQKIASLRPDCIVILSNGSAITMEWADQVDAILETWLGGQGVAKAVAKIIFGIEEPSGRLSETFPLRLEDDAAGVNFPGEEGKLIYGERMFIGYRHYEKQNIVPAFPFGYGLSYTKFAYSDLQVSPKELEDRQIVTVSFTLKNIGERDGTEVVQLYISNQQADLLHPCKELKAFEKTKLKKGEERRITFALDRNDFSCYNSVHEQWIVSSGKYEIQIGTSSAKIELKETILIHSTDCLICELTKSSRLMDWLDHPLGKHLAEEMLAQYQGFGIGVNGKRFDTLSHFVKQIMLEMPMPRLITASNHSFTKEQLEKMLLAVHNKN